MNAPEAARRARLRPRPKSVGWNPFNASSSSIPVSRRSRPRNNLPDAGTSVASAASAVLDGGSALGSPQHTDGADAADAAAQGGGEHVDPLTLSRMPDTEVWSELSTYSLRDLAAGHHCAPPPEQKIHPLLSRHRRQVSRRTAADKRARMMSHLQSRERSRWRLMNRKRERIAVQSYVGQPVLHIPDPDVTLRVSDPLTIGQVLRTKYEKTHPPPSYNVKVYRTLKKRADLRALRMIRGRFDQSEHHDHQVATIKDYTRGLSRGSLRVSAMKRSELETRLGTPFAMSGASIYAKPEMRERRLQRLSSAGSHLGFELDGSGETPPRRRAQTAAAGAKRFSSGAFDVPSGVARPGSTMPAGAGVPDFANVVQQNKVAPSASAPALHHHPETTSPVDVSAQMQGGSQRRSGGGGQQQQQQQQQQRAHTASATLGGPKKSALVPVWQRDPHEHWKPPSHYLKKIERSATAKSKTRQRGGFPNKYLYPIEVMGLDTLFPD